MLKKSALVLTLLCASSPALADYWLVLATGELPNRRAIFVNDANASKGLDLFASQTAGKEIQKAEITATIVFESPLEPSEMTTDYRINCTDRTASGTPYVLWHDTDKQAGFALPADDRAVIEQRIMEFACDEGSRNIEHAMLSVGQPPAGVQTFTWKAFWADGREAEFTTSKSMAQIEANHAQLMHEVDELQARSHAVTGQLEGSLVAADQDMAADIDAATRKANRNVNKHYGQKLESWIGQDEAALVQAWGIPQKSYAAGGIRFVAYDFGYDGQYVNQYGAVLGSESYHCYVSWQLKGGRIIDYRASGNYCRTSLEGR
ncbi:MAG: hypothetical protein ACREO3_05615 [Arenimonas sp.]